VGLVWPPACDDAGVRGEALRVATFAATIFALTCAHRPCPPVRPYVKTPARAPTDAATAAAVAATGARYQNCPDGAAYLISRAGTRDPTSSELGELLIAVFEPRTHETVAKAVKVNCLAPGPAPTLRMAFRPGTFSPDELARKLTAAADRVAPDATVYLEVSLLPTPGPRCAPDDPACGPLPYEGQCAEETGYDPKAPRKPAPILHHDGGACSYDGECIVAGCGNDCGPPVIEDREGTCELYRFKVPVYCGCVNRRCTWFTSRP
jgi:hypothetical protein